MAQPRRQLADSLALLKALQDSGQRVIQSRDLTRADRERLLKTGFLHEVLKGWYLPGRPDLAAGDSAAWFAGMRDFIAGYCNARFGEDWHVGPEQSLMLRTGERTLPRQILVWCRKGNNQPVPLPHGCSMYLYRVATGLLPSEAVEDAGGLRLATVPSALAAANAAFFSQQPVAAQLALRAITDATDLLRILLENSQPIVAGRLAGGLRAVDRSELADEIINTMRSSGHRVPETQPFDTIPAPLPGGRLESPYAGRTRLMWQAMREQVIGAFPATAAQVPTVSHAMTDIDARYVADAYNSLSIEGYQVTPQLIERVRNGTWDPDGDDRKSRDAMAAKGYLQAHKSVKEYVRQTIADRPKLTAARMREAVGTWYRALFSPSVHAGLLKPADLAGWRNDQAFIKNARHVPLPKDAVRDSMPVLFELLAEETHAGVRAVLGHFVFVYIHPYMDGNGRLARFLMNAMLVTGGYVWTIIPLQRRDEYMRALDAASSGGQIRPFANFIGALVSEQTKNPIPSPESQTRKRQ